MSNSKLDEYFRVYEKGRDIFQEGNKGDAVFLIKSGTVDVLKNEGEVGEQKITSLGDGEIIGEMAMRKGEHERTATVRTTTEVRGWRFPGPAFESLIHQDENFRERLFQSLIDRLIQTTNRLHEQETAEIQELNDLIIRAARGLLPDFTEEEIEENESIKKKQITVSPEFLSYHYEVNSDVLDTFRSLGDEASTSEISDEDRIQVSEFAQSVLESITKQIRTDFPWGGQVDEELANAARTAKDYLDELEDHTETFEKEKLQGIMEVRNELTEVLEEKKENGNDGFMVTVLERYLEGIKQEVNIRYE